MFKLLLLAGIAYLVYVVFFKKTSFLASKKGSNDENLVEDLTACPTCHTYISHDDAILSQGQYYCSQECLDQSK